jgi:hypothetical protein
MEPQGVATTDLRRPDGISLIPWQDGRCCVWDFTSWDTLAPSHVKASATKAGSVAAEAERRKSAKYADLEPTYQVIPVCVETLGTWGPSALQFIKSIGQRIRRATDEPRSTSFLIQAVSMAIQVNNAVSVLGCLPDTAGLAEVL